MKTANEAEERQALMELAAGHGVDLDERRAARAVAAGRGDDLRRRILQGERIPPRLADGGKPR
jgi:hypothetical protein